MVVTEIERSSRVSRPIDPGKIFVSIMFALQLGSMAVYFAQGDWHRGLYWLGACVLTLGVTL